LRVTLRSGSVWIADQFADGEHQFVDAVVQFAGSLGVLVSHLPKTLLSARLVLVHALCGRIEPGGHLIETAARFRRKLGDQSLERNLILGEDADHLFQTIQSLPVSFRRHDSYCRICSYLSKMGEQHGV